MVGWFTESGILQRMVLTYKQTKGLGQGIGHKWLGLVQAKLGSTVHSLNKRRNTKCWVFYSNRDKVFLQVDDWLLPKGSLLVCFSHRDKAKLLVFYSHGWSKGMVALKVSWSAVSLYFNGFQLSRTNKWVFLVLAGGHGKDWTVGQPIGKRVVHS